MLAHKDQVTLLIIFPCKVVHGQWINIAQVAFLCKVSTGRLRQHCIGYFPAKRCLCAMGQHCTTLSETYLDNIDQTIFLCNVVPAWSIQRCIGYFSHKFFLFTMAQHCTDPERSGHHCRIISIAKLFMDFAVIGGCNDRSTGGRQNFVF